MDSQKKWTKSKAFSIFGRGASDSRQVGPPLDVRAHLVLVTSLITSWSC